MIQRNLIAFALESAISAQLFLFAIFLLSSRRRRVPALYLLAALSGCLAAMIAGNLLIRSTGWFWLADMVLFLDLLTPAVIYLYVRQVHHPVALLKSADAAHVLPALVGIAAWKSGLLSSMDVYAILCWGAYLAATTYYFSRD